MFGAAKTRVVYVWLLDGVKTFHDVEPFRENSYWSVTDRRKDGRTSCDSKRDAMRIASRIAR